MSEERKKNEGTFMVKFKDGNWPITMHLNDFYIKDGFVVVEHKDGGIEYWPETNVSYIGIRGTDTTKDSLDKKEVTIKI